MTASWYALQSKPNKEDSLFEQLENQGFEVFYPRIRVSPINPRAKKVTGLFPRLYVCTHRHRNSRDFDVQVDAFCSRNGIF